MYITNYIYKLFHLLTEAAAPHSLAKNTHALPKSLFLLLEEDSLFVLKRKSILFKLFHLMP